MKRDMDFVRAILLTIEDDPRFDGNTAITYNNPDDFGVPDKTAPELSYHLQLLISAGLISGKTSMIMPIVTGLTWRGHEFLDATRKPEIWDRTKALTEKAGGSGFDIMISVAKGLLEAKLKAIIGGM